MPNRSLPSMASFLFIFAGTLWAGPDDKEKEKDKDKENQKAKAAVNALIDKALAAHGGEAKVAKLKVARIKFKGKQTIPGRGEVPMELEDSWQLPGQYRTQVMMEVGGVKSTQILVLNGDKGWINIKEISHEMDDKTLAELKEQIYAESLDKLFPLRERGYEMTLLGEEKVEGRPAAGIKVSSPGHKDVSLYFDKESGFVVKRVQRIVDGSGKEVLQEVVFANFKEVDGLKHHTKLIAYRNGRKMIEGEVTEIKLFDKLDESLFSKP